MEIVEKSASLADIQTAIDLLGKSEFMDDYVFVLLPLRARIYYFLRTGVWLPKINEIDTRNL